MRHHPTVPTRASAGSLLSLASLLAVLLVTTACNERVNVNTGSIRTCPTDRCSGPAPGAPSYTCADGTQAGPACLKNRDDTCSWGTIECPPPDSDCTAEECGPAPGGPALRCGDQTLMPQCLRDGDGECAWRFPRCGIGRTCEYDGQTYQAGDTFPSSDGCNSCFCDENGTVGCTLVACVDVCITADGEVYEPGESFPSDDGCNQCTCQKSGEIACTDRACAKVCEYNGQTYQVGDVFESKDGCNSCQCMPGGSVGCSVRACPKWFRTCGDPVCMGTKDDPAVRNCTEAEVEGAACSEDLDECELLDECNTRLRCTTIDPTQEPGGCPISAAKYKKDVQYLDEAQLEKVARELLGINLATYRYNAAGAARGADTTSRHLGFIIDDVGPSACVNPGGETVNLYGYTSMAVAALQVQAKQIAALKSELAELRKQLESRRR